MAETISETADERISLTIPRDRIRLWNRFVNTENNVRRSDTIRGFKVLLLVIAVPAILVVLWQSTSEMSHPLLIFLLALLLMIGVTTWAVRRNRKTHSQRVGSPSTSPARSLAERHSETITAHWNRLSLSGQHDVKDAVRDCIGVIANQEGRNDLAPSGQYLYKWEQRSDIPDEYRRLAQQLKADFGNRATELQRLKDEQAAFRVDKILSANCDLVDKFLEIAERKVSVLDDYGDEQWDSLPGEIVKVLRKISERERLAVLWDLKPTKGEDWRHSVGDMSWHLPEKYRSLPEKLLQLFLEHHERAKSKPANEFDVQSLSGVEFETYISRLLRSAGYDVQGTPTTGDQGADLIAKKDGRTVIIQAKRYQGAVGNKAVQEVISAISFYGGDEGWVVTNSTFTPSAIALAQKANVKLIDGAILKTKSVL